MLEVETSSVGLVYELSGDLATWREDSQLSDLPTRGCKSSSQTISIFRLLCLHVEHEQNLERTVSFGPYNSIEIRVHFRTRLYFAGRRCFAQVGRTFTVPHKPVNTACNSTPALFGMGGSISRVSGCCHM
jgi:hypothetical protein